MAAVVKSYTGVLVYEDILRCIKCRSRLVKMVLFHIAAIGWISPQTGYKIQCSYTKLNHIVKTKIGNLKATLLYFAPDVGFTLAGAHV